MLWGRLLMAVGLGALQALAADGYLGVQMMQVDAARAKELRLAEAGVVVTLVSPGSPADAAGLRSGDAIVEFGGQKVEEMAQLQKMVRETPPGRSVKLRVLRNGAAQVLTAKIGGVGDADRVGPTTGGAILPPQPDVSWSMTMWRSPVLGIEAEPLVGQMAAYFGVADGVLVRSVFGATAAEKAGLRAGDVILRVGAKAVTTPAEITARLRELTTPTVRLAVMREREEIMITVTFDCLSIACSR